MVLLASIGQGFGDAVCCFRFGGFRLLVRVPPARSYSGESGAVT
jgi:hypothetical protein